MSAKSLMERISATWGPALEGAASSASDAADVSSGGKLCTYVGHPEQAGDEVASGIVAFVFKTSGKPRRARGTPGEILPPLPSETRTSVALLL